METPLIYIFFSIYFIFCFILLIFLIAIDWILFFKSIKNYCKTKHCFLITLTLSNQTSGTTARAPHHPPKKSSSSSIIQRSRPRTWQKSEKLYRRTKQDRAKKIRPWRRVWNLKAFLLGVKYTRDLYQGLREDELPSPPPSPTINAQERETEGASTKRARKIQ